MTWINARRDYPRNKLREGTRRKPGRPDIRAHVVGVWCIDPATGRLHKAWHHGRTLVCVAGPVSTAAVVMIEMECTSRPIDWQAKELKKRLKREGFRDVHYTDEKALLATLKKRPQRGATHIEPRYEGEFDV